MAHKPPHSQHSPTAVNHATLKRLNAKLKQFPIETIDYEQFNKSGKILPALKVNIRDTTAREQA